MQPVVLVEPLRWHVRLHTRGTARLESLLKGHTTKSRPPGSKGIILDSPSQLFWRSQYFTVHVDSGVNLKHRS